jgi:superfamily II DNA or RNA helicase
VTSRNASLLSIQKGLSLRLPPELSARPVATLWEGTAIATKPRSLLRQAFQPVATTAIGDLIDDVPALRKAERRVGRFEVAVLADAVLSAVEDLEATLQRLEVPEAPLPGSDDWAAWAELTQTSDWLELTLDRLEWSEPAHAAWVRQDLARTVGEAMTMPGSPDGLSPDRAPQGVQARLRDLLLDRAYDVAEALEREATWLPTLDPAGLEHEGLRTFAERLLAARARARLQSSPRGRKRGERRTILVEHPLQIQHREDSFAVCGDLSSPRLIVDPRATDIAEMVTCRCTMGPVGRCSRAVSAMDAALEVVFDGSERSSRLAELIDRPAWQGALHVLDGVLDRLAPGDPEAPERIGWRLRTEPELELQMLHLRPLDNGRMSGRRVESWAAEQRLEELGSALDRQVHRIARGGRRGDVLEALRVARRHDRLFVGATGMQPLSVREATPSLALRMDDGGVLVEARMDGRSLSLDDWAAVTDSDEPLELLLDAEDGHALVVRRDPDTARLLRSLGPDPVHFDRGAVRDLLRRVPRLKEHVELDLPEELAGRLMPADPTVRVRLEVREDDSVRVGLRVRPLAPLAAVEPGVGRSEVFGVGPDGLVRARRDLDEEVRRAVAMVAKLGLEPGRWTRTLALVPGLQLLERVAELGIEAEWLGPRRRRVGRRVGASDLTLRIRPLAQWFGLEGELQVGDSIVPLADAVAAAESGLPWVRLDDESFARLEPELARLLLDAGRRGGDEPISPLHAPAFEAMEAAGVNLDAPGEWLSVLDRVRSTREWTPELPEGLLGELRDYQVDGFVWMARLAGWAGGAVLADDMGLGKTVQALAILLARQVDGPSLVVAPTSVGWNWLAEAERFAPSLKMRQYRGVGRQLGEPGEGDVIVTSYDLLRMDAAQLTAVSWGTVVFDESQALKNAGSQRYEAALKLNSRVRLALSGTPVENRTAELWSIFNLLAPGYLGGREAFRQRFAVPIEREDDRERRELLARMVRPFILRRRKREVAKELPPRTDIVVPVELSLPEQQLYDQVRSTALALLASGEQRAARMNALASLTRLRQAACHPALLQPDTTVSSSKQQVLLELMRDVRAEGHKALVFSQFTTHLKLARTALEAEDFKVRYLDGSTPAGKRRTEVEAFQGGAGDAFLISLRAGGTGLNLTAATYVIHLDPWWNPAVEDQASDRAHRIGQDQPVTVYRLVSQGTVEEAIVALHDRKRRLAEDLLAGTGSAAAMSVDELVSLIAGSADDEVPER